jgi:hypothetical protein
MRCSTCSLGLLASARDPKSWNALLLYKSSPTFGQNILIGENFGHISIESSKIEGSFSLILKNQLPINGKSFSGDSLMMLHHKIQKRNISHV